MRHSGVTLGPYFRSECQYPGDTNCRCNQGVRRLAIVSAAGTAAPYSYDSGHCGVVYRPKDNPVPVILAAALSGGAAVLVIGLVLWYAMRMGKRDNSAAPKDAKKPFCVLFTDIESSTHLWATIPEEMTEVCVTGRCTTPAPRSGARMGSPTELGHGCGPGQGGCLDTDVVPYGVLKRGATQKHPQNSAPARCTLLR